MVTLKLRSVPLFCSIHFSIAHWLMKLSSKRKFPLPVHFYFWKCQKIQISEKFLQGRFHVIKQLILLIDFGATSCSACLLDMLSIELVWATHATIAWWLSVFVWQFTHLIYWFCYIYRTCLGRFLQVIWHIDHTVLLYSSICVQESVFDLLKYCIPWHLSRNICFRTSTNITTGEESKYY